MMLKRIALTCLYIALLIAFGEYAHGQGKKVSIKDFGAKGNGQADDADAFMAAVKAGSIINIPPGTYLLKKPLFFRNLNHKTIVATGATIVNADNSKPMIFFEDCSYITFTGGKWTRLHMPKVIGPSGQEHTFTFAGTDHVVVNKVTIDRSPQMGICMMNVIDATISNNTIRNCFRDGIYAHYSVNLSYVNNHLDNIKDDAMSMHDYGLQEQKAMMHKFGYTQSGHGIVKGNTATNCYEGFSSIGCDDITVTGNTFKKTVDAGIAIFNSEKLFKGSTARAQNITITDNILSYNDGTQTIMGVSYPDRGQLSSGRSAIYVAVNDDQDFILHPTTRIRNVVIKNNQVSNGFGNGIYLAQIDKLVFQHNTFTHCNINHSIYTTQTIEINNCTDTLVTDNQVKD